MEFTKDDNTLQLLPNIIKISDVSNNSITLNNNGNIVVTKNNDFSNWNDYYTTVTQNSYHGTTNKVDLEINGGNISLGNPNDTFFSGRFRHFNMDISNTNEDLITSRFIGTQFNENNIYNTATRYSGVEILTNYVNNSNYSSWNENLNFLTTKNASVNASDSSLNSFGKVSASVSCHDQLSVKNTERFGSFIINTPSTRNILTFADSMAVGQQLFSNLMKLENMKLCQNYIPSQKLEVNNGNIAFTSYFNNNTSNTSFNNSNDNKATSLNKHTITGLNQVIYDTTGSGSYGWKWGNGIGSFLNYGRGYYEFPENQITSWTGNGNNEANTDIYYYNNVLNNTEKQTFRRTLLNNTMMAGMLIEQNFENHKTFIDQNSASEVNSYDKDIENKQPPSESIHFITYSSNNKEWLGESIYKGLNGSKLIIGQDQDANQYQKKTYGGEIRMTVHSNGYIGVGTTTPEFPFEVKNFKQSDTLSGSYLGKKDQINQISSETFLVTQTNESEYFGGYAYSARLPITMKLDQMLLANGVIVYSDERIKTDIEDVPDDLALNQINSLETKYYHYKDPMRRKQQKTIGFIAQNVKEVIPNAATIVNEYIPDELRIINDIVWVEKDNHFYFTIDNLDLSTNNTGFCRFYLSDDASFNNYETLEIKVEEDNKMFKTDYKWKHIYLWGKQVNDFNSIDKNQIFALHHSAIQELSKKNNEKDNKISQLENDIKLLKEQFSQIETIIAQIQNK